MRMAESNTIIVLSGIAFATVMPTIHQTQVFVFFHYTTILAAVNTVFRKFFEVY